MEYEYQYLILGGGLTGAYAIEGIRRHDRTGSIGLLSAEKRPPYLRPDLSKKLLLGKKTLDQTPLFNEAHYQKQKAVLHLKTRAVLIDAEGSFVLDDTGNRYAYSKLLIATGGHAREIPMAGNAVHYYRTIEDYLDLNAALSRVGDFLVIGGGFIGAELAAALAMNGKKVSMLLKGNRLLGNILPADLSDFVTDYYRQKGVALATGEELAGFSRHGDRVEVLTRAGHFFEAGWAVAGIGLEIDTHLAESAGLRTLDGILVNEYLQTSRPEIFAAGDLARFHYPDLEESLRVEHHVVSETQGRCAGANMAGARKPYDHLPFFYSDMFELGFEAVGKLDSRMETYAAWDEPFKKGIVAYLEGGRIKGLLLWNKWGRTDWAGKVISNWTTVKSPVQLEKLLREEPLPVGT